MQAIILAAGMGKRLKELTNNSPKCMLKVNGVSIIDRMLHQIESKKVDRIIIVVGYERKKLKEYISTLGLKTPIIYIDNHIYNKTNNIYSLALAKEYLCEDDTLLFESDLIFEDSIIDTLLNDSRKTLALVDKYESWMDGTCVKLADNDTIEAFIPGNKFNFNDTKDYYKTVNIYKFSKDFSKNRYIPFLDAYMKTLGENEYYEQVLRIISNLDDVGICVKKLDGELRYEIDDIQDLDIAESLFTENIHEKYNKISNRYGGYWRYPKLLDFSNPFNPEFPPQRLKDEIKASSDKLLTHYPSGMKIIKLLASKVWGINSNFVVVVNGIESCVDILSNMELNTGVILPTRVNLKYRLGDKIVPMELSTDDFSYSADDIINFYSKSSKKINCLFIYNPGYHTGFYLNKEEVIKLLKRTNKKNIKLIYDESTLDFINEEDSLINNEVVGKYNNLIILKDMSVSQGINGIRLACLFASDRKFLDQFENKLPCWNIDSYAEFYLQIMEKYSKAYKTSLIKFKDIRSKFVKNLQNINGIHIVSQSSNYILCRIGNELTSKTVSEKLLDKYNILVRDLSETFNYNKEQFIKISVRNEKDNIFLTNSLHNIMTEESRCWNKKISLNNTQRFFEERGRRKLPNRYNYVIYHDSDPEVAIERDKYEKNKMLPYFNIISSSEILDVGCGVGRWADKLEPMLKEGKYVGIDYSGSLLKIAKEHFISSKNTVFLNGSFQNLSNILSDSKQNKKYDLILINGILMYINDNELENCISSLKNYSNKNGIIYIKESVGVRDRFTLNDFFSDELKSEYSAIYRSLNEYQSIFRQIFLSDGYSVVKEGETRDSDQWDRNETVSYFWIIRKD